MRTAVFHDRLQGLRRQRRLSRYKLALLSGIAPDTLKRLESPGGNPTLSTLISLTTGLDVDVGELTRGVSKLEGN